MLDLLLNLLGSLDNLQLLGLLNWGLLLDLLLLLLLLLWLLLLNGLRCDDYVCLLLLLLLYFGCDLVLELRGLFD